jgi:hypothetical protein
MPGRRRAAVALTLPGLDAAPKVGPVSPQARAMSSLRSKAPAPAPKPWHACILAVDTAKRSGWSFWWNGQLQTSGEIDTLNETAVREGCRTVGVMAKLYACPAVLVLEKPWGGQMHTVMGLAMARERWIAAWKAAGEARSRVVSVSPSTWRPAVMGRQAVGMRRAEVRAMERFVASPYANGQPLGDDEAAAILIGKWASHAAKVGEVIGAKAVRKSVAAWSQRGGAR